MHTVGPGPGLSRSVVFVGGAVCLYTWFGCYCDDVKWPCVFYIVLGSQLCVTWRWLARLLIFSSSV